MPHHILLTIDVEDWFQVKNLKSAIPFESWPTRELRVEKNTHRILDLLDEASLERSAISFQLSDEERITDNGEQPKDNVLPQAERSSSEAILQPPPRIHATFFVLGWLAERLPHLVREIKDRGHEVASHGYGHELCSQCSSDDLKEDLAKSKKLLEDIIGARVYGYRAPSFSISDDILQLIAEAGYQYDSSYNSFTMHGRYGKISLNGSGRKGIAYKISPGFYELPVSNLTLRKPLSSPCPVKFFEKDSEANLTGELSALSSEQSRSSFVLPWGGGAYFRLIPGPLFRMGVREILRRQQAYLFYMHPWEVDPEQPRPEGTKAFARFKHYTNLSRTEGKLRSLLQKFSECSFVSCHEYLQPSQPKQLK